MSRKITLISFYFAPLGRADGVNRSYLARYLGDLGWDINVVCAENPRGLLRNYQQDTSLLDVLGSRVTRYSVPYRFRKGIPELLHMAGVKPDPFTYWAEDAIPRALEVADGILYAVVPPVSNATVAIAVARARNLPLVLDFRDNVSNLPKEWVGRANAILASTDWSRREMLAHYGTDDATKNLTYFNGFPDQPESPDRSDDYRRGIIYAGLMNWEQHPFLIARLLDAARKLAPALTDQLHADFFGPPNYYTRCMWHGRIRDVATLHGYLPFDGVRRQFLSSQFGLATLVSPSKAYCIPSKVFQYIAAGLPIIACSSPGALQEMIRDYGIGLHAQPSQIADLAPTLIDVLENPARLKTIRSQLSAIRDQFSLRSQVAKVSALLDQIGG